MNMRLLNRTRLAVDKVKLCTRDGLVSLCRINLVGTRIFNLDLRGL